jgi:hypothetical protein
MTDGQTAGDANCQSTTMTIAVMVAVMVSVMVSVATCMAAHHFNAAAMSDFCAVTVTGMAAFMATSFG